MSSYNGGSCEIFRNVGYGACGNVGSNDIRNSNNGVVVKFFANCGCGASSNVGNFGNGNDNA